MRARAATLPGPVANAVGWIHLVYLGLLPALGTFALVYRHGSPELPLLGDNTRALIGLCGFVIVAMQMAMLVTYTRFSTSWLAALVMLADGPLLALVSCRDGATLFDFAIRAFFIDGAAVPLGLGALVATTRFLDGSQRAIGLVVTLAVLAVLVGLFWPYLAHDLPRTWRALAPVVGGVAWASVLSYRTLDADRTVRKGDSGAVTAFLLGFSFLWLIGYGVGVALHPTPPPAHAVKRR